MTTDGQYEQRNQEIKNVFGERKSINKKFLATCESKLNSIPQSENATKWIIGKLAFQQFDDVWKNFETIALNMTYAVQNLEHRIEALEKIAIENGAKIDVDEIASVAKFAKDFNKHIEEVKKANAEYKRKMEENDLAT
jgi:hypothetical protein